MKINNEEEILKEESETQEKKNPYEFNKLKNFDELKKVVEQEIAASVDSDKIDITFDTKIFQHGDEERRVTY